MYQKRSENYKNGVNAKIIIENLMNKNTIRNKWNE